MRKLLLILTTLVIGGFAQALLRMEGRLPSRGASGRGGSGGSALGGGGAEAETQCAALTSSGSRCTRPAQPGSAYCWQHEE